ncbi:septal ring lytic transglycosylase RlpA family protein [Aetokthonos hydrillicola Thurmond2011]|jgi:rare lipoprotein A|uniref:Probable endolytic peptidoglycan transglycosylase RlpA n=1 Tax=Aetokthonos hydrillicola Thurmond2011 TaxID=2712845 RepID=A0AAP5IER9_9CYAN|nr:septal ring lytic transglycosylase RlpA family protein [Aetokthonos hydrillicola]MBO3457187.1 septal ring lytic transglycosylase RlpA family protein [Aetokthonos hydrillicola CCALA 1050]MBW4587538.1 septal ring lytic transglycosylase RlpA family protein [Aetokthonos hydrillicola CCALA 1050]MDR9900196.1 septal ring lytic transglycosylase RlpA family protein [Aetokthonos hydrillicola Thurmond2011]
MNQRHFWTVVALFTTVLGTPSIGRAETTKEKAPTSAPAPSGEVMKVGEYKSPTEKLATNAVVNAEIHTHEMAGHQAATLYVRKIPVLTFIGQQPVTTEETKVGVIGNAQNSPTKVAKNGTSLDQNQPNDDPIQRATLVAAKINQLILDKVDASKITVSWKAGGESTSANEAQTKSLDGQQKPSDRYILKVNGDELVEINSETRLSDTTNNPAKDALQVTNRLRRLIGNASPITQIANLPGQEPKSSKQISIGPVKISLNGVASWYGYDGSGSQTAAGERYNPEGMTAAHRSLPLGTKVRVTNTRNGRSVVVRINDRGPYVRGRIIDLSAGAARILGMMGSGVAHVRIDVLGR